MKTLLLIAALLIGVESLRGSDTPPLHLVKNLTAVIREHCPYAVIETTNGVFSAKHGTMVFTEHGHTMTGEFSQRTHQREGPNFKGFLLTITVKQGAYGGQAVVPQELRGPYFPTYINAPATEDGMDHYWISFSYGSRLDPALKQAIFAALPGAKFQQDR